MKKRYLSFAILWILPSFVSAVTLDLGGSATTLYWAPTRIADTAGLTMTGAELFWQVQGSITQELTDGVKFKGGIEEDPILRRRLFAQLGFDLNSLNIEFTPFVGILNTAQKWFNPGLEAAVQYTFPGVAFVKAGFSTSFAPLSKAGDYYVTSEFASLGWFMGNGIVTLSVDDKSSTLRGSNATDTIDSSTKILLDTEIFVKNFPLRPAFTVGYQATTRTYVSATQIDSTVHSALLGGRLVIDIGKAFSLYFNGLVSVFNFAGTLDTIVAVPDSSVLYQLQSGVRIQL